jgi:hypothetical protein
MGNGVCVLYLRIDNLHLRAVAPVDTFTIIMVHQFRRAQEALQCIHYAIFDYCGNAGADCGMHSIGVAEIRYGAGDAQ